MYYNQQNIPVISIVGYSGTGKTTMLEKLILELKKEGIKVAVVKHDGHEFEIDKPGKDSWRMTKAGADVVALLSSTKAVVMENRPVEVDEILDEIYDVDLILIEGYKHKDWPKILLYRKEVEKPLAANPEDCFAVMSNKFFQVKCSFFDLNDIKGIAEKIINELIS